MSPNLLEVGFPVEVFWPLVVNASQRLHLRECRWTTLQRQEFCCILEAPLHQQILNCCGRLAEIFFQSCCLLFHGSPRANPGWHPYQSERITFSVGICRDGSTLSSPSFRVSSAFLGRLLRFSCLLRTSYTSDFMPHQIYSFSFLVHNDFASGFPDLRTILSFLDAYSKESFNGFDGAVSPTLRVEVCDSSLFATFPEDRLSSPTW
mmetsp:Transcript_117024/g.303431  ORF Transcript_117024/g.303431 Transcript_117024/m.303431 type:complete len:206 (+) Transcript_117024:240-857(+)